MHTQALGKVKVSYITQAIIVIIISVRSSLRLLEWHLWTKHRSLLQTISAVKSWICIKRLTRRSACLRNLVRGTISTQSPRWCHRAWGRSRRFMRPTGLTITSISPLAALAVASVGAEPIVSQRGTGDRFDHPPGVMTSPIIEAASVGRSLLHAHHPTMGLSGAMCALATSAV
jgi:hypothetical protein